MSICDFMTDNDSPVVWSPELYFISFPTPEEPWVFLLLCWFRVVIQVKVQYFCVRAHVFTVRHVGSNRWQADSIVFL